MVTISGGDKLKAALEEISKKVSSAASVDVGFLPDATYPDGTPVAMVAAIQEFGAPGAGIPPRPFFRKMIGQNSPQWPKMLGSLLQYNDMDAAKSLGQIGVEMEGELRESIVDLLEPELSPVTLMLRKMRRDDPNLVVTGKTVGEAAARVAAGESYGGVSTKPLVDTGHLLNSIDSVVHE